MRARNRSSRRTAGWLVLTGALFLAFGAATPAQADFLDDLFGGGSNDATPGPAPRARPSRGGRDNFSIHLKEPRRAQRKVAREAPGEGPGGPYVAGSRPQKPLLCMTSAQAPDKGDGKSDESVAYLRDETLRAGDSIVTPGEIVVFKGGGACPHVAKDFVSLARSGLPKVKRNALAALQQGLKSPSRAFDMEDARPTSGRVVGQVNH
jgi:hypothetical protein